MDGDKFVSFIGQNGTGASVRLSNIVSVHSCGGWVYIKTNIPLSEHDSSTLEYSVEGNLRDMLTQSKIEHTPLHKAINCGD